MFLLNHEGFNGIRRHRQFPIRFINDPYADLPAVDEEHHEVFLMDIYCGNGDQFLNTSRNKLAMHYTWLIFGSFEEQVIHLSVIPILV